MITDLASWTTCSSQAPSTCLRRPPPGSGRPTKRAWTRLLGMAEQAAHDNHGSRRARRLCAALAVEQRLHGVSGRADYLRARLAAERGELPEALEPDRRSPTGVDGCRGCPRGTAHGPRTHADPRRPGPAPGDGRSRPSPARRPERRTRVRTSELALCERFAATAYNNLGATYCLVGDHERSMDAYAACRADLRRPGTVRPRRRSRRQIEASPCWRWGARARRCRSCATQSETFAEDGDRLWAAKCDGYVAQAHQQLGELVARIRLLHRSRAVLDELGAHAEAARTQLALAGVYLTAGLLAEARDEAAGAVASTARQGLRHDNAVAQFTARGPRPAGRPPDDAERGLRARCVGVRGSRRSPVLGARAARARRSGRTTRPSRRGGRTRDGRGPTACRTEGGRSRSAGLCCSRRTWPRPTRSRPGWTLRARDRFARPAAAAITRMRCAGPGYARHARPAGGRERWPARRSPSSRTWQRISWTRCCIRPSAPTSSRHMTCSWTSSSTSDTPTLSAEACAISDDIKSRTLLDMVSGTIGARHGPGTAVRPRNSTTSSSVAATDLAATYNALAAVTSPMQRSALLAQAEKGEAQIAALRLRRTVTVRHARCTTSVPRPSPISTGLVQVARARRWPTTSPVRT